MFGDTSLNVHTQFKCIIAFQLQCVTTYHPRRARPLWKVLEKEIFCSAIAVGVEVADTQQNILRPSAST